jgi:hypothetical protein
MSFKTVEDANGAGTCVDDTLEGALIWIVGLPVTFSDAPGSDAFTNFAGKKIKVAVPVIVVLPWIEIAPSAKK